VPTPSETPVPPVATPTAGPPATATPSVTASPTPTPAVTPLPVPTIDEPKGADVDRFWAQILDLSCVEFGMEDYWDSVDQMTRDVEVIVVGRPISIELRRDADRYEQLGIINVAVDEVIKGDPRMARPGVIQVSHHAAFIDGSDEAVPANPTVFFLRNLVDFEQRQNIGVRASDEFVYYVPGVHQNVIAEIDGRAYVPQARRMLRWHGPDWFPLEVHGMSFARLLDQIRQNVGPVAQDAGRAPAGGRAGAGMLFAC